MSDAARLKATIYIGGLDPSVSQQTLHSAFIPFGDIVEINLPKPELPSSTEPHRGFGYVEFESAEDAREAIDNMDQSELFGRVVKCAQARPEKKRGEGLGSKTAVWEQEGYIAENAGNEDELQGAAAVGGAEPVLDPMQGLEALDYAGPKPES